MSVHYPSAALLSAALLAAAPAAATTYEVGPGQPLSAIGEVPWESLAAGDLVRIHARPEPYAEKWVVCGKGTEAAPIRIEGVPDPLGALPVVSADGRLRRRHLHPRRHLAGSAWSLGDAARDYQRTARRRCLEAIADRRPRSTARPPT